MSEVELVHWNPRRRVFKGKLTRRIPISGKRVSNFGDLLGPRVVNEILSREGLANSGVPGRRRLVSIGSVMHLARNGDVIWGTGVNGKHVNDKLPFSIADIRAVRGPLTRDHLQKNGHSVPEIFGDPGLLVGELYPSLKKEKKRFNLTIVPNLNDIAEYANLEDVLEDRKSVV